MSRTVPLPPLQYSLITRLEEQGDEAGREAINALATLLRERQGWMGRKKLLLDHLDGLEKIIQGGWLHAAQQDQAHPEDAPGFASAQEQFSISAPIVIGAALEALGETEISSVEQAACYILSSHAEHHHTAFAFLQEDPARVKAWRKLMRNDRKLNRWIKMITKAGDAFDAEDAAAAAAAEGLESK